MRIRSLVWSCTAVALLSGCGGSNDSSTSTAVNAPAGGTAVVAIHEEPTRLNPVLGPAMSYATLVEAPMFPNLFRILPSGALAPDLATIVPTVANGGISRDGLTYTFHLRDATWSDGTPLSASDVLETYRILTDPKTDAISTNGYSDVKSATVVDAHTIRFVLTTPYAPFLAGCWSDAQAAILPAHVFENIADVNTASYNQAPTVTLGPFRFDSWQHGTSIVLDANPHYYGTKPKLGRLVFQVMPDQNTILSSLQAGSIHLTQIGPTQVKELTDNPAILIHVYGHTSWEAAALNEHDPILADVRVRQALEYGVDRAAIATHVLKGYAQLIGDSFVPSSWAYDPTIAPYPYDPKKAAALLDAAGWKLAADGVREKAGKPLELSYATTSGNPGREEAEQIMQSQLAQIGVHLTIANDPADVLFGDVLFHGKFQIAEFQPTGGPDPDTRAYQADSCHAFPPGGANYGFWCDPRIDGLFAQEQRATDIATRKKIFGEIAAIENAQAPYLYLYAEKAIVATSRLNGYVANPNAPPTWNSEMWSLR